MILAFFHCKKILHLHQQSPYVGKSGSSLHKNCSTNGSPIGKGGYLGSSLSVKAKFVPSITKQDNDSVVNWLSTLMYWGNSKCQCLAAMETKGKPREGTGKVQVSCCLISTETIKKLLKTGGPKSSPRLSHTSRALFNQFKLNVALHPRDHKDY